MNEAEFNDDETALEPLQKWPDNVNPALWRSRRALMGDPDQGMPRDSRLHTKYQDGLRFMRTDDPVAAGQAFTEAAQEGHPGAIREIALAAFDDLPGEIVWAVAPLFERAAAAGDGRAMAYLGLFCRLRENSEGALEYYRASDQGGDPEGSRELGILLSKQGLTDEALEAMKRARDRGSASGALAQGILLRQTGDRDGAREAFLVAAEMGHPKGSLNLIDLFTSEGNHSAADAERNRALQNLAKHQALMDSLQGEGYADHVRSEVEVGRVVAANSGGSCALPAMTVLIAVLALASVQLG